MVAGNAVCQQLTDNRTSVLVDETRAECRVIDTLQCGLILLWVYRIATSHRSQQRAALGSLS